MRHEACLIFILCPHSYSLKLSFKVLKSSFIPVPVFFLFYVFCFTNAIILFKYLSLNNLFKLLYFNLILSIYIHMFITNTFCFLVLRFCTNTFLFYVCIKYIHNISLFYLYKNYFFLRKKNIIINMFSINRMKNIMKMEKIKKCQKCQKRY